MSVRPLRTPSYRRHKPTGQAVVTLSGRDFYLGRYGSRESRAEYDRLVTEWLSNGRGLPRPASADGSDITINEMLLAFDTWAEAYYRKGGVITGEVTNIRYAIKLLRQLYGSTMAREFGPLQLKTVRQAIAESGLCRNEVNRRTRIIVRAFRWAVSEGMIPPSVHHGLQAVSGLRRGRCDVRESEPVKPVPDAFVEAVRPHVSRRIWTMIELQRLTGMRPGEVCTMRTIDVDTTGRIWIYTPESHKTEHHGRDRKIYLGPTAQTILRPWLRAELTAYLFSPAESEAERRDEQRRNRKSRVQPSQPNRRRRPRTRAGERYDPNSYRQAIQNAIRKANREAERLAEAEGREFAPIPDWHPNMLRHAAATRLRREFGLDVARAVLGHSSPAVTEVYAELDATKAWEAMERIG
jgi:integrase